MKFKYLKHSRPIWMYEMAVFLECGCPLPYQNLPDGKYLIRGNVPHHRKEYWKLNDRWFLIEDIKKDKDHRVCDIAIYETFPQLAKKEWEDIERVGFKKLKRIWVDYYIAWQYWNQFRETRRISRLSRIQILEFQNK